MRQALKKRLGGEKASAVPSDQPSTASNSKGASKKPEQYGLKVLVEGEDPIVDIVAIHGLNGGREKTWTAPNGDLWLRDAKYLPKKIPNARILTWGYDATTHSTVAISVQALFEHSGDLVLQLQQRREITDTTRRPIIFVVHSLGGLVLNKALLISNAANPSNNIDYRSIKVSTYGIVYCGTPHLGGNLAEFGSSLISVASIFMYTNEHLVKQLQTSSKWTQEQLADFTNISTSFDIHYAYETHPTRLFSGKSVVIVPRSSAVVPGTTNAKVIGIQADHSSMIKFSSNEDSGYETISTALQIMLRKAPIRVAENWTLEDQMHHATLINRSSNLLGNLALFDQAAIVPQQIQYVNEMNRRFEQQLAIVENIQQDTLLRLLHPRMSFDDENRIPTASPHTCLWQYSNPLLKEWLYDPIPQPLLVVAEGGMGKSVFAKSLARKLRSDSDVPSSPNVIPFFCRNQNGRNTTTLALSHVLYTILSKRRDLFRLLGFYQESELQSGTELSFQTIWSMFKAISHSISLDRCYIILDGLDECSHDSQRDFLFELAEHATEDGEKQIGVAFRILVLTRPTLLTVNSAYNGIKQWTISKADIRDDIAAYLDRNFSKMDYTKRQQLADAELSIDKIVPKLNNSFLQARFIVDDFLMQPVLDLSRIPDGLFDFYEQTWNRLPSASKPFVVKLISILLAAERPLNLFELGWSIGSRFNRNVKSEMQNIQNNVQARFVRLNLEEIKVLSIHYVTVKDEELEIAHSTVRDFFSQRNTDHDVSWPREVEGHRILLCASLGYILLNDTQTTAEASSGRQDILSDLPFLDYACSYWPTHARGLSAELHEFDDLLQEYLERGQDTWEIWRKKISPRLLSDLLGTEYNILHILAFFNVSNLLQRLSFPSSVRATFQKDELGRRPLILDFPLDSVDAQGNTPMLYAVQGHSVSFVQNLIDRGANFDKKNDIGCTALVLASSYGHLAEVTILAEAGANVNQRYDRGSPIQVAAKMGHEKVFTYLISKGASYGALGKDNITALHYASGNGRTRIVKRLIQLQVDLEARTVHGMTALHFAAESNSHEAASELLSAKAKVDPRSVENTTPLHHAAQNGHITVMELLLKHGASLKIKTQEYGWMPIHLAANNGRSDALECLLRCGREHVDALDTATRTPLIHAVIHDHVNAARVLLKNGANVEMPTKDNFTPLVLAVYFSGSEMISLLIEFGARPNKCGGPFNAPPLYLAAIRGLDGHCKSLLQLGALVDGTDRMAPTPLFAAIMNNRHSTFNLLLEAGASTRRACLDFNAFHIVLVRGRVEMLYRLIWDRKAGEGNEESNPLEDETGNGFGVLTYAAGQESGEMLKLLLGIGVNPNKINRFGMTPLHTVLNEGLHRHLNILIEGGADPDREDCLGRSARYWIELNNLDAVLPPKLFERSSSDRKQVLLETVAKCISRIRDLTAPFSAMDFGLLGRCLVDLGYTSDAAFAYGQRKRLYFSKQEPKDTTGLYSCDHCGDSIENSNMEFYSCTVCAFIQLCGSCMPIYEAQGAPVKACKGHEFLRVPENPADPFWTSSFTEQEAIVAAWLDTLPAILEEV